jgi:hypothetical protein
MRIMTTNKYYAKDPRVRSLSERYKHLLTRHPLLIVRLTILWTGLLTKTTRPVRNKTYQEKIFAVHSTWSCWWWWFCPYQDETTFLIDEVLRISPTYSIMGESHFRHIFTYPWSPYGWQASSIWSLLDDSSWICISFLYSASCWYIGYSLDYHIGHHLIFFIFFLFQPWSQHMVHTFVYEKNLGHHSIFFTFLLFQPWSQHMVQAFVYGQNLQTTQCKHQSIGIVINYQNHTWRLYAFSPIPIP